MSTGDGLDRIQPADKKSKVRCALLTHIVKTKMGWIHFIKKGDRMHVYRCLTVRDKKHVPVGELADCCKKLNNDENQRAQVVFAVLAVRYKNADPTTGKYKVAEGEQPPAPVCEIGWLKLSRSGYKQISELVQEGEQAHMFGFTIGYKDNKIGYNYSRVSQKARWQLDPEVSKAILEEAQKYADGTALVSRLGKVVTAVDMKAVLAGQSAAASTVDSKDIDNTKDL